MSEHVMASADLSERVHDWYALITRERATQIVEFGPDQWGLLTPEWPVSYANNGVLVRRDPGFEKLIDMAEELLADPDFKHRYIMAMCDLSPATLDGLQKAGYTLEPELQMVRPLSDDDIKPVDALITFVDEPTIRPFNARLWREEWLPTASDDTIAQLVGRRDTYSRSTEFISMAIINPEGTTTQIPDFVASCDVAVRDWAAEIDGVVTVASHRRKGYGDVLIDTALSTGRSHGCDYIALTALATDWPQHWYARRGFFNTGPAWVATKILNESRSEPT
jgi:GNAT superfamily N-acetyltransferase